MISVDLSDLDMNNYVTVVASSLCFMHIYYHNFKPDLGTWFTFTKFLAVFLPLSMIPITNCQSIKSTNTPTYVPNNASNSDCGFDSQITLILGFSYGVLQLLHLQLCHIFLFKVLKQIQIKGL